MAASLHNPTAMSLKPVVKPLTAAPENEISHLRTWSKADHTTGNKQPAMGPEINDWPREVELNRWSQESR